MKNTHSKLFNISIIIPTQNDLSYLKKCLECILKQTIKPNKIIIIDSSSDNKVSEYLDNYLNRKIKFCIKRIKKSYAGKSINYGYKFVNDEYVGLLDTKTFPNKNWIEKAKNLFEKKDLDIVFGKTIFKAKTLFQKFVQAISYGNISHETVPGTIFKSKILKKKYILFNENVRSGYDIEWKQNLKKYLNYYTPENYSIVYESLSKNIIDLYTRYIIYSFHSARIEILTSIKSLYLSIFFIVISFLIPQWNLFISGWQSNPLYIPYISRIYLLALSIIFFSYAIFYYFYLRKLINFSNILFSTVKIILFLSLFYGLYKTIPLSINNMYFSFNNIEFLTNFLLITIILISLLFRGIVFPLNRNIDKKFLFPFNFIPTSLLGLSLDILKSPFYIFGAIIGFFNLYSKKNNIFFDEKHNIVFYSKYGSKSASIRYRFDPYIKILKKNNYNVITQPLFDDKFFQNKIFDNKINYLKIILNYTKRILDITFRKKPFIAIIHIELLPFLSFFGEFILKLRGIKYIVDIDDAVYHRFDNKNFFLKKIIQYKFNKIIKFSDALYAGNKYHINYFKKYSNESIYMPTVIDPYFYKKNRSNKKFEKITLVWIGSPTTSLYLNLISNVLNKIKIKFNIDILIIGLGNNKIQIKNYINKEWSSSNEIELLSKSHIGIMPLENDLWSLGKCGFKILQYMGAGIPVVASPIGVNKEIIQDGKNGYLANNNEEWFRKIENLILNENIRSEFSTEGFKTLEKKFNIEFEKLKFVKNVNKINQKISGISLFEYKSEKTT